MTDTERIQLFKLLFPLIHLTIGEMMQATVAQSYNGLYVIIISDHFHMGANFTTKAVRPLTFDQEYAYCKPLSQADTDEFWQKLHEMLSNQPLIVNGINQNARPIELKPFDADDWDAWGGAERPEDSEPLISQVKVQGFPEADLATIIMDATGIDVYLFSEEPMCDVECWYEHEIPWPKGKPIIDLMYQPITPQMLKQYGFIKVN